MTNKTTYLENVEKANKLSYAYYTLDNPQATDAEYDILMKKIKAFEKETGFIDVYSPTQRIGDVILEGFEKIKHEVKMYSLEDIFDKEELRSWFLKIKRDIPGASFYAEPKYDGLSLNITYENGVLVSAGTRGTGEEGENVTENVHHILGIPLNIPSKNHIEIRGEVVIFKENFEEINKNRVAGGKSPYANERNAAAGALRSFESRWVKNANLRFVPYGVGRCDSDYDTQIELAEFISDQGFTSWGSIGEIKELHTIEELEVFYQNLVRNRNDFRMLLDGMVIKVNDLSMQETLGFTSKTPKWAVAYKFPAQEKTSKIEDIILQVGKTGAITPVAVISPTDIDGSTIRRVTLHNFEEIQRKDIRIGDTIGVIKSGDVIPKITSVFTERRDGSEPVTVAPEKCPVCGSKTEKAKLFNSEKEGSVLKCSSSKCPAVLVGKLQAAAGKKALDIDALGESTVELLVQKGIITDLKDFFSLRPETLLELEGFQKRKAEKTVAAIQAVVGKTELHRFIKMFDIELIGERASIKIAKALGFRAISPDLTLSDISSIEDIGDAMAHNYYEFVSNNEDVIHKLYDIIQPIFIEEEINEVADIAGKKFVITGTLSQSRGVFKKMIESAGGKVSSGVSKSTDYLLAGAEAGSKLTKAEELGVHVLDEDAFNNLMGQ